MKDDFNCTLHRKITPFSRKFDTECSKRWQSALRYFHGWHLGSLLVLVQVSPTKRVPPMAWNPRASPIVFSPPHNQGFVYLFVWSYFHHLKKSVQIMVRKNILNFINFENVWNKNERKSGGRGSMFIVGIRHFINAVLNRKSMV